MPDLAGLPITCPRVFPLYYGGQFREPFSEHTIEVRNPATGALIATVPEAGERDVAYAVETAVQAQPAWGTAGSDARARVLMNFSALVRERIHDLAELESAVTGRPIREMRAQMSRIPEWLDYFASIGRGLEGESNIVQGGFLTYTRYQPLGVCALLTPWNHPVLILVKKLGAALAAGNACVVKPSELAPVSPLLLAALATEAGLPEGLFNVVTGAGSTGAAVCVDPRIARIDLTGGTATGRRVAAVAGERLVPVTLELGGKAPVLVCEDVDLDEAVAGALFSAFVAAGQTCVSGTRFIVADSIYENFLSRFAARARSLRIGDPADPATDMGPVISASARDRCLEFIASAKGEGARLITGGGIPQPLANHLVTGHFVEATIFADVTPTMRLFREEVFGPVVAVSRARDERHALELANDTEFALGAGIWTRDIGRAHRLAAEVRAGVVWINDHHKNDPRSIWGGFGASGYGKENGWDALKSYLRKRSVVVRTEEAFSDWFAHGDRYG